MDLFSPSNLSISLTQLRGVVGRFLQEGLTLTSTDDVQNFIRFVSESIETGSALLLEEGRGPVQEQRSPSSESMTEIGAQYSSLGKVLSKPSLIPRTKSNKILPINHNQSSARALSVLNSPTFAHVLLRTFSCTLLAITNTSWLIYFVLADFGSYFLWKIARNDFHYWANVDGILRYTISIISRVGVKIMVDYTLMIQLRHPWEYGGFPFLCSILISIAANFVSAYLYLNHNDDSDDEEDDTKLDEGRLRVVLGSLYLFWLISAISLVATMKRKYLRTFFSIEKGKEYSRKYFLSLQGDQEDKRHVIFFDNPDVYRKWGEELIKPWTLKNWSRWEEEKPAWFTVKWVEHVPNHYIPYDFRVKYKKTQGRVDDPVVEQRRRSSIQQVKSLLGVEEER